MNNETETIYSNLGIAEIFLWISVIISAFFATFFSIVFVLTFYGMLLYFEKPEVLIAGIIGFIFLGPSLEIALIVGRMKYSIREHNINGLKALNSKVIYISAIFFTGVVPGIILLYLYNKIASLEETGSRVESMDKIEALIRMFNEKLISKDEFIERKKALMDSFDPVQFDINHLKQMKDLLDGGKISEADYEDLKKKVLSKY